MACHHVRKICKPRVNKTKKSNQIINKDQYDYQVDSITINEGSGLKALPIKAFERLLSKIAQSLAQ